MFVFTDCNISFCNDSRCIQRYEGHANRAYQCGIALSPCGRFLCTGSEDKSVKICAHLIYLNVCDVNNQTICFTLFNIAVFVTSAVCV